MHMRGEVDIFMSRCRHSSLKPCAKFSGNLFTTFKVTSVKKHCWLTFVPDTVYIDQSCPWVGLGREWVENFCF